MGEIVRVYRERLPSLRFIGKRYTNAERANGFGHKWGEWFQNGWFGELEALGEAPGIENGYLGFMRCGEDFENTFEYWIGMFFPADTPVPEGYGHIDLDGGDIGVCWIKGREDDGSLFCMHDACVAELAENGMGNFRIEAGMACFFERYNCPRFTQQDEQGNVILDYCVLLAERDTPAP